MDHVSCPLVIVKCSGWNVTSPLTPNLEAFLLGAAAPSRRAAPRIGGVPLLSVRHLRPRHVHLHLPRDPRPHHDYGHDLHGDPLLR